MGFDGLGVKESMLVERLGHDLSSCDDSEIAELFNIARSIKDGMSSKKDWFKFPKESSEKTQELNEKLKE
jgi:hypothetical protein